MIVRLLHRPPPHKQTPLPLHLTRLSHKQVIIDQHRHRIIDPQPEPHPHHKHLPAERTAGVLEEKLTVDGEKQIEEFSVHGEVGALGWGGGGGGGGASTGTGAGGAGGGGGGTAAATSAGAGAAAGSR